LIAIVLDLVLAAAGCKPLLQLGLSSIKLHCYDGSIGDQENAL
jgi:hypothetical protein